MNDLQDKIFLSQNPCIFGRALEKKNYWMTQLIEQIPVSDSLFIIIYSFFFYL